MFSGESTKSTQLGPAVESARWYAPGPNVVPAQIPCRYRGADAGASAWTPPDRQRKRQCRRSETGRRYVRMMSRGGLWNRALIGRWMAVCRRVFVSVRRKLSFEALPVDFENLPSVECP